MAVWPLWCTYVYENLCWWACFEGAHVCVRSEIFLLLSNYSTPSQIYGLMTAQMTVEMCFCAERKFNFTWKLLSYLNTYERRV